MLFALFATDSNREGATMGQVRKPAFALLFLCLLGYGLGTTMNLIVYIFYLTKKHSKQGALYLVCSFVVGRVVWAVNVG
jgi:hypothetical protein